MSKSSKQWQRPGRTHDITLRLDVISDVICPWCFLGKRRLEQALQEFHEEMPSVNIEVEWRPWLLAPKLPAEGVPKQIMYLNKFKGNEARLQAMIDEMTTLGKADDIAFTYEGTVGPTMDAHRLIWSLKGDLCLQDALVEELFVAYHERGENPADHESLLRSVDRAQLGLDAPARARALLQSREGEEAVRKEIAAAHGEWDMMGGVPHIYLTISGTARPIAFAVPGAQDAATFLKVFRRAFANSGAKL